MPLGYSLRSLLLLCLAALACPLASFADPAAPLPPSPVAPLLLPDGVGVFDVKRHGGAVGDGVADDTAALRDAILSPGHRVIYLSAGTYLVREPLLVGAKRKLIVGESRDASVIRLAPDSPAFADPAAPAAVLSFIHPFKGWHYAQNFFQRAHSFTIEVAAGNPGAVGLDFHTNNGGDVFNLSIRSTGPDRAGLAGLRMTQRPGPGLVHHVFVEGFDHGLLVTGDIHGMFFESITVRHQRVAGFTNQGNTIAVRRLHSQNQVPALSVVAPKYSHTVLVDAVLERSGPPPASGNPAEAAIKDEGATLYLRDVRTSGYRRALAHPAHSGTSPTLDELALPAGHVLGSPRAAASLRLPVDPAPWPEFPARAEDWTVVRPGPDGDLSVALQTAIDAGAIHILLPADIYGQWTRTVRVHGATRLIYGLHTRYQAKGFADRNRFDGNTKTLHPYVGERRPRLRVEAGEGPFAFVMVRDEYGDSDYGIEHAAPRDLLVWGGSSDAYINTATGGRVWFIDRGLGPGSRLTGPQSVWSWHVNVESLVHQPQIENHGAHLWMLGLKTERDRTAIGTYAGGRTELIGGLLFKNREAIGPAPAFIVEDATLSAAFKNTRLPYLEIVRLTREGKTESLPRSKTGPSIPLLRAE